MSLFPGSPAPELTPISDPAADGYLEHRLTLATHTGTHLDAPSHLFPGGAAVSELPLESFIGPALLLDVRGPGSAITSARLEPLLPRLAGKEFALLHTGWGENWGAAAYLAGWPALTPEAARMLAHLPLKGVGVDALSLDGPGSRELPVHRLLLGKGMVLVENLANLESLPRPEFTFLCLPLPLAGADGSPVRAAALW
jgi:arylformamidase